MAAIRGRSAEAAAALALPPDDRDDTAGDTFSPKEHHAGVCETRRRSLPLLPQGDAANVTLPPPRRLCRSPGRGDGGGARVSTRAPPLAASVVGGAETVAAARARREREQQMRATRAATAAAAGAPRPVAISGPAVPSRLTAVVRGVLGRRTAYLRCYVTGALYHPNDFPAALAANERAARLGGGRGGDDDGSPHEPFAEEGLFCAPSVVARTPPAVPESPTGACDVFGHIDALRLQRPPPTEAGCGFDAAAFAAKCISYNAAAVAVFRRRTAAGLPAPAPAPPRAV